MATPSLQQDDLKALDQARQRLSQLANNIASLKSDIQQSNPLPPWESIQTSASILSNNINSIVEHLARNADLLNRTVAYPSTNYPGRTQEGLLGQLLRKKMEPQVETWVDEGREIQDGEDEGEGADKLWAWGRQWIGQRVATYILEEAGDSYTVDEREAGVENVRVGLRRMMEEEEEMEEGDEEMEDVGLEVTTVGRTTGGQVEYGLEEVRKSPDGRSRGVDEILKLATSRPGQLVR